MIDPCKMHTEVGLWRTETYPVMPESIALWKLASNCNVALFAISVKRSRTSASICHFSIDIGEYNPRVYKNASGIFCKTLLQVTAQHIVNFSKYRFSTNHNIHEVLTKGLSTQKPWNWQQDLLDVTTNCSKRSRKSV